MMSNSTSSTQPIKYQSTQQKTTLPATMNVSNISNTKRVKVTLACAICRKKKVKCDGIQPSCSRCNSMGFSCEYSDPPKKRGPPKGQVEIIESRARRIESLRVGNGISQSHKLSSVSPALVTHEANGYAMIGDFYNNGDNTLFSLENNTVLRLISGAVDVLETTNKYSSSTSLEQQSKPGSHYIKNDFFMKDNLLAKNYQKWTSCYFGHFNVFFPVLSQPHYMQQLAEQKVDPLLFYAVCMIGSTYSDHDQETSRLLFEICQYFLHMSRDSTTLYTVQALVLLCWNAYLQAKMQACGAFRRRLNQAVNDLQLYRDPEPSFGMVSIEIYRRAFWVTFVTDQWLSCCTGERCLILPNGWNCQWPQLEDNQLLAIDNKRCHINKNDDMVHTQTQGSDSPDSSSHFAMPDLSAEYALQITAFAEMIKLACIVDEMHDLYASSKTQHWNHQQVIVSRLTHWLVHLPSYLEYDKPKKDTAPSPIARIYHMLYYTVQIMLYQPCLQQQHINPMTSNSPQQTAAAPVNVMARAICTNAANTIVHISQQMIQHHQYKYLHNTFMISLTLASSVHLDNAMDSNQTDGISSLLSLRKSLDVLKNGNGSVLSPAALEQLLNRFLLDQYGIRLDGNLGASCRSSCLKRRLDTFMDDEGLNGDCDSSTRKQPRKCRPRALGLHPLCTTTRSSSTKLVNVEVNNKDDLLDTRLYHLLQGAQPYTASIPSPSSSSSASNVLDASWLDETKSILDLFPEVPPTAKSLPSPHDYSSESNSSSPSSKQSYYSTTPVDSLYSPISFISPTQSPNMSPDSNPYTSMTPITHTSNYILNDSSMEYFKLSGQYDYSLVPPTTLDSYALTPHFGNLPPHTH